MKTVQLKMREARFWPKMKFEPIFFSGSLAVFQSERVASAGEAEGGVWGREFRLARAEAKPRRPARSEQNPAKKFSFPFRRKKRGAQIKKCEENFFAGWRALASGGGAERQNSQSGFSSKKVRILTKRHRQLGNVFVGSPSARARQPILTANWNFLSLPAGRQVCPATAGLAKSGLSSFLIGLFSFYLLSYL